MSSQQFTTNSLTSWLSHMKTDDIDDGLAADFDGSLSGLGVELGSSTYNMSEALLALPVFKEETADQGFQYILSAATSPATKLYEETLTYLNQGQPYEIKVKKVGDCGALKGKKLQSVVRVMFHERRLQYNEKEQLEFWMKNRPGERIVDVDVPLSYGVQEVKVSRSKLNCIELTWDPCTDCGIFIKINAISTEFTPRKHGGEKGVPFRIQVETYNREDGRLLHGASCQVKVFKPKGADRKHKTDREKIEKRSEAEKAKYQPSYECTVLAEIPLDQIRSYLKLLQGQEQETPKLDPKPEPMPSPSTTAKSKMGTGGHVGVVGAHMGVEDSGGSSKNKLGGRGTEVATVSSPTANTSPNVFCIKDLAEFLDNTQNNANNIPDQARQKTTKSLTHLDPLSPRATAHEVTQWLHKNRFSHFVKIFENFAGADLLRLTRDDLIQICGLADGIRLDNALQSRTVRPKLTIYVNQPRRYSGNFYGVGSIPTQPEGTEDNPCWRMQPSTASYCQLESPTLSTAPETTANSPAISRNSNTGSARTKSGQRDVTSVTQSLTQPVAVPSTCSNPSVNVTLASVTSSIKREAISISSTDPSESVPSINSILTSDPNLACTQSAAAAVPSITLPPSVDIPVLNSSPQTLATVSSSSTTESPVVPASIPCGSVAVASSSNCTNEVNRPPSCSQGDKRSSASGNHQGWKRHFRDEPDSDTDEIYYTKKQRTRTLELSTKGVYHAVYLEFLTVDHLKDKLADLFSISGQQILEVHVQGPSGILVLVTDNVVQNLQHQTRYNIEAYEDDVMLGLYKVLLQSNNQN